MFKRRCLRHGVQRPLEQLLPEMVVVGISVLWRFTEYMSTGRRCTTTTQTNVWLELGPSGRVERL
jgi:hypothetical protein